MDIQSLIQACADGVASGGFEVLGGALLAATINLVRRLRDPSASDDQARRLAEEELADSERLARDLEQASDSNQDLSLQLREWVNLAGEYVAKLSPSKTSVINSNYIGSIQSSGPVNITQTVNGAPT